jgi:hypothetical protein
MTMDIQRRSYRNPINSEGRISLIEIVAGLKTKKVISRYSVKMNKKIRNRLSTHKIVFGILNRENITVILNKVRKVKLIRLPVQLQ